MFMGKIISCKPSLRPDSGYTADADEDVDKHVARATRTRDSFVVLLVMV